MHFLIIFIELSSIVFLRYRLSCCIRDSKIQHLNSFLPQNPLQTSVARGCGGGGMTVPGSPAGTQCPLQCRSPSPGTGPFCLVGTGSRSWQFQPTGRDPRDCSYSGS